jgi:hypothetical protein
MLLRAAVPEHHVSAESRDLVKLAMGLIGTMAALVLGLLIASAKSSYDTDKAEFAQVSANVSFLDRVLSHYGPEAQDARHTLRRSVGSVLERIGADHGLEALRSEPVPGEEALYDKIQALSPRTDAQRAIQAEALKLTTELARTRWLLVAQEGSSIPTPFLVLLVSWLTVILGSFGFLAPRNGTVLVTLLLCGLSMAGAVFLILELDQPFQGLVQISSESLRSAFNRIGR